MNHTQDTEFERPTINMMKTFKQFKATQTNISVNLKTIEINS